MKFMLDTDSCIYVIKKRPAGVLERLRRTRMGEVCLSTITLSELEYGVEKSKHREQNRIALAGFAAPLELVPYDDLAAQHYGNIRAQLEREGQPLGALDTLIAAHARALGATLVTNNVREFARVAGLKVENWAR